MTYVLLGYSARPPICKVSGRVPKTIALPSLPPSVSSGFPCRSSIRVEFRRPPLIGHCDTPPLTMVETFLCVGNAFKQS